MTTHDDIGPLSCTAEVAELLQHCGLPVSDIGRASDVILFGRRAAGRLVGVVGLEFHGTVGLLRSLAVVACERRNGLGEALLAHAERAASKRGVRRLYLLTTTAAVFFERRGYVPTERSNAPAAIAGTAEFSSLCPVSSSFLCKLLQSDADQRPVCGT